ncbi:MurR/RpiR family transcriptional regulator [Enterococcus pallens]|uniref:HTH rpiR-type domain-containing protein n=1 Tax=Enterococcus pallens ATCC BAA-351 TaxID=1158607 RepID=R2STE7_9ENTE|nr:MurR/RpiR family transcriptional regulator [Enterococcus pallens]EOH91354.1 hypothetical protein UAU_03313 [Enterococcus pallens ATCC BAA-351]EOU15972.1 hypothetical protein I588_03628 [Enterococcus pallens ATCC BAA-351]OJG78304.1 hypothetical protein RV10_GL001538 [Enterococcus pallens]
MKTNRLSLLYNIEKIYNENKIGSTDYQLARYLLENYADIPRLNIYDVAEQNHMSRATVRRFCNHLGYANFKEMKSQFKEFEDGQEKYVSFYSGEDFRIVLQRQINEMIDELAERMNTSEKKNIVNRLIKADEVIILASSTVASSIRIFQQNLAIFGKRISLIVSEDELKQLKQYTSKNSLLIVLSISGLLAESLSDEIDKLEMQKVIFTIKRNPEFNRQYNKIYHLCGQDSHQVNEVLFYTYGITFVLDLLFKEYLDINQKRGH